jgi:hypothetical protein
VWPGVRQAGLVKAEPGADAGPGAAQRRRLMRSIRDYSAENGLHIEGAARALTSAARSAHPAHMSHLWEDLVLPRGIRSAWGPLILLSSEAEA